MKYNEELVSQVREGKLAVHNINCTKEELQDLIKYIFPRDFNATGECLYYRCYAENKWFPTNDTTLPYKSVKEFLEEEFILPKRWCIKAKNEKEAELIYPYANKKQGEWNKSGNGGWDVSNSVKYYLNIKDYEYDYSSLKIEPGYTEITFDQFCKYVLKETNMKEKEIIGYKLIKPEYEDAALKIAQRENFKFKKDIAFYKEAYSKTLLEKAGVLDIWFEPIYKEEKKLPKINGYDGKLDGDYIIYGSNCARFQKRFFEILEGFHKEHPQFNNNFSNQNRTIKAIKLDSGVEITMEQVKEIVEFLNTKN